jgi:hypothetical protein
MLEIYPPVLKWFQTAGLGNVIEVLKIQRSVKEPPVLKTVDSLMFLK